MKRWLTLCLLLVLSSGCMLFDDLAYHDAPPWEMRGTAGPPVGTCGPSIRNVSATQTAEPELLR